MIVDGNGRGADRGMKAGLELVIERQGVWFGRIVRGHGKPRLLRGRATTGQGVRAIDVDVRLVFLGVQHGNADEQCHEEKRDHQKQSEQ